MCRLFETIKIENGLIHNLELHNERLNNARHLLFGLTDTLRLSEHIVIPGEASAGIFRCRIIYDREINTIEFFPYSPAAISTLKIIDGHSVKYDYKYLDRSSLNELIDKNIADDVLIVKDGYLTDVSFANIVFTDGIKWVTPKDPLLRGTMREKLLRDGVITTQSMTIKDLSSYTHFRLINAMLGFSSPLMPVGNILE